MSEKLSDFKERPRAKVHERDEEIRKMSEGHDKQIDKLKRKMRKEKQQEIGDLFEQSEAKVRAELTETLQRTTGQVNVEHCCAGPREPAVCSYCRIPSRRCSSACMYGRGKGAWAREKTLEPQRLKREAKKTPRLPHARHSPFSFAATQRTHARGR